jgi:integrase
MLKDVRKALREEYCRQMMVGFNKSVVDGYSGFIFTNKDGYAYAPKNIISAIDRIVSSYNKAEVKSAASDERIAVLLPRFTPHVIRHTFCTRMCENESNLKVIQEIMGHGSITITMDVYADANAESKHKSFANLEGKFKIG